MRRILINAYTIDYTMIFNYNQGPGGTLWTRVVISSYIYKIDYFMIEAKILKFLIYLDLFIWDINSAKNVWDKKLDSWAKYATETTSFLPFVCFCGQIFPLGLNQT